MSGVGRLFWLAQFDLLTAQREAAIEVGGADFDLVVAVELDVDGVALGLDPGLLVGLAVEERRPEDLGVAVVADDRHATVEVGRERAPAPHAPEVVTTRLGGVDLLGGVFVVVGVLGVAFAPEGHCERQHQEHGCEPLCRWPHDDQFAPALQSAGAGWPPMEVVPRQLPWPPSPPKQMYSTKLPDMAGMVSVVWAALPSQGTRITPRVRNDSPSSEPS